MKNIFLLTVLFNLILFKFNKVYIQIWIRVSDVLGGLHYTAFVFSKMHHAVF